MNDESRFTYAADGTLLDVASIDPRDRYARGPYACLACGHLMVPALGKIRRHHFKHKAGRPPDCANETYLHQLGKLTLFNAISEAMQNRTAFPLIRHQKIVCDYHEPQFKEFCQLQSTDYADDLASRFDCVEMEKGIDGFVADVLLTSSGTGEVLLLEIAVSHVSEEDKTRSGLSIVEITVRNESDVEALQAGIHTGASNVRCFNLPPIEPVAQTCQHPCDIPCSILLLYKNGKVWYTHTVSSMFLETVHDPSLATWKLAPPSRAGDPERKPFLTQFKDFIVRQKYVARRNVRSCMLCRHNGGRKTVNDIHCNALNRTVWMSSSACDCSRYSPGVDAEEAYQLLDRNLKSL